MNFGICELLNVHILVIVQDNQWQRSTFLLIKLLKALYSGMDLAEINFNQKVIFKGVKRADVLKIRPSPHRVRTL
jgi:hypothetical protein